MNNRKTLIASALALALSISASHADTIKIGVNQPLTGSCR